MAITTKTRKDLKSYFVKNAIPTESNFAELVDAPLNQADDGVFKLAGEPLSVVAASGVQKRVLRLYADYPVANPDWLISLNPAQDPANAATNRPGFGIADGAGNTRLFLDASGRLGLGTNEPQGIIDARIGDSTNAWHRFVVTTTSGWDGGSQHVTIGAGGAAGIMFSNPHVIWQDNRASIRYGRTGGTPGDTWWDVGVRPNGSFGFSANENGGAGELVMIGKTGVLNAKAGVVVEGGSGHLDRDGALYRHTDGQVYLTVDDNLFIRDSGAATWAAQFDTNTGSLNLKGALNASTGVRASGNGGVLDVEGSDHSYIEFYPQKLGGGRKGWMGYGSPGATLMTIVNEAGELALSGAKITANAALQAKGDFDVDGSATLGLARTNDNFNAAMPSGFYQSSKPGGRVPDTSNDWVHMLVVRHSNTGNNHQLQIASSYAENDKLYFRKIARGLEDGNRPGWNEVATAAAMPKIRMGTTVRVPIANGSGTRQTFAPVNFGYTFAGEPSVVVALNVLDTGREFNLRITVHVDSITATTCRIVFTTWGDSIVWNAAATWIAVGV